MDPVMLAGIEHVVSSEGVEHPALPRRHVDGSVAALELDAVAGDDRHVDANAVEPVQVDVEVRDRFAAGLDAHQACPTHRHAERCDRLRKVRAGLQPARRRLRPADRIVGEVAVDRDEADGGVARVTRRVTPPGIAREFVDLVGEAVRVELQGKANERLGKLHVRVEVTGHERVRRMAIATRRDDVRQSVV